MFVIRRFLLRMPSFLAVGLLLSLSGLALAGCGSRSTPTPTRTPVPTYTPTPLGQGPAVAAVPATPTPQLAADTPTPVPAPPTNTPLPPTPTPTSLPPTATPTATSTPTVTPTPTATPTPDYAFALEETDQFPTQLPDVDEVRIYAYIYSDEAFALPNYSLHVERDGEELMVQAQSSGGLPGETRPGPSPYTRFANLGTALFQSPAGVWTVQLVDSDQQPVGPSATFVLGENDPNRELYLRYRRKP